jgi:hypothetical protein
MIAVRDVTQKEKEPVVQIFFHCWPHEIVVCIKTLDQDALENCNSACDNKSYL